MQCLWQRDASGNLARIVHRRPAARQRLLQAALTPATARALDRMLGIAPAYAQAAPAEQAAAGQGQAGQPGALGLPAEAGAFFDERYLWSGDGLLLHSQRHQLQDRVSSAEVRNWAYDGAGQLIAGVQTRSSQAGDAAAMPVADAADAQSTHVWRYAYQGQRRVLAQEAASQDTSSGTIRTAWDAQGRPLPGSDRAQPLPVAYDANGQPARRGSRHYRWDALGRLAAIDEEQGGQRQTLARYRYDHRGLRIAKQAGNVHTRYLHGPDKHLLAEVDSQGQLRRQYIFLADLLLATIDTPAGRLAAEPEEGDATGPLSQEIGLWGELKALMASYAGNAGVITHIHANHLGAPEAATDATANLIWQADYAPFGAARIRHADAASAGPVRVSARSGPGRYVLHVRLPGQYFDEESGLHYNRQRYYDPQQGAYLSPDPLGHPDGPNAYAYAGNNPLAYIDPDGLVLFAFDGTGNSNDPATLQELDNGVSNVWQFRQIYDDGNARYITGVGTRHRETDPQFGGDIYSNWGNTSDWDMAGNYTGPERIERMIAYFNAEAELFTDDSKLMDVDIIGFSRGAAQARDFANRINAKTKIGQYIYTITVDGKQVQRCQMINFRFLGLWDTVLSTNWSGTGYNLGIVPGFQHVAQAVALNEYRGKTSRRLPDSMGAFPLESIMGGTVPVGQTRIEMGFLGSHSDIGGGFQGQDDELPLVALSWMVEQARDAGVRMRDPLSSIAASTVLDDKSDNQYCLNGPGCSEDRAVHGGGGGTQRQMTGTGMTYTDTGQFINYYPSQWNADGTISREPRNDRSTGAVNMSAYMQWLRGNGYDLGKLEVQ